MNNITINIFCIIANTGSDQELYLKDILSDKYFVKHSNLSRLIYNTTKPKDSTKSFLEKYNYLSFDEFNNIPQDSIIDSRSYYTIPYDIVYYFTLDKDISTSKKNLICIASPYQYENYKRWISIENIKNPNSYNIYAILIHCNLHDRFINKISVHEPEDDIDLLEFCRRILQDNAEFKDAQSRIPELNDPMNCTNVCYVNNNKSIDNDFKINISQIKGFILDKVKNNQICYE